MSDVDTSAEAVEGLAKHHDLLHPKVEKVTLFGDTSQKTADVLRALKAERDGLKVSREAWAKAVGAIVSAIPLGDVIKASGTLGDTIDYVKSAIAERDALRTQLAEARDSALEEAARLADDTPHYTKHDTGVAGIFCDISTPPSDVAQKIRSLKTQTQET